MQKSYSSRRIQKLTLKQESDESQRFTGVKVRDKITKGYHKLLIWQRARELVVSVYKNTESFPKAEEFGLKGQLRRAAVSVLLNIVEGNRRASRKDFLHFLGMSVSSLTEIEAAWELSLDLGFISQKDYEVVENKRAEVAVLLNAFIKGLRNKTL